MTILLVNDDGYKAEGIRVLEEVLASYGHEIWVCAPSCQKSASSHSMTLSRDIVATEYGKHHWYLDGYPADCILYALRGHLFPHDPDVVVSGINHGYNISTDVLYSGTVGAASEAAMTGIPAFALSCQGRGDVSTYPFHLAARFLADHLSRFLPLCSRDSMVSINVPAASDGKTWRVSTLSHLFYDDAVLKGETRHKRTFDHEKASFGTSILLGLKGGTVRQDDEEEESDFRRMEEGVIAVTVLGVLPAVDEKRQESLRLLEAQEKGADNT